MAAGRLEQEVPQTLVRKMLLQRRVLWSDVFGDAGCPALLSFTMPVSLLQAPGDPPYRDSDATTASGHLRGCGWNRGYISLKQPSFSQITRLQNPFHGTAFPRNPSGPRWGLQAARRGWDQI